MPENSNMRSAIVGRRRPNVDGDVRARQVATASRDQLFHARLPVAARRKPRPMTCVAACLPTTARHGSQITSLAGGHVRDRCARAIALKRKMARRVNSIVNDESRCRFTDARNDGFDFFSLSFSLFLFLPLAFRSILSRGIVNHLKYYLKSRTFKRYFEEYDEFKKYKYFEDLKSNIFTD